MHSDNMLVKSLANRCLSQCLSNMGKNIVHINKLCNIYVLLKSGIQIEMIIGKIEQTLRKDVKLHISETERTIGSICRELMDIRYGTAFCLSTPTESSQLVNSLSTS